MFSTLSAHLTQTTLRALDWLTALTLAIEEMPESHRIGRRGEEDAYFYLRRQGYKIIARNYRSPLHRGELDLVGWDRDVLCVVEVKTRTKRDFKPAEAAVDREKQRELSLVAREFLRQMPRSCGWDSDPKRSSRDGVQWRFDVLAVYYERGHSQPSFELFQNAFAMSYNRGLADY